MRALAPGCFFSEKSGAPATRMSILKFQLPLQADLLGFKETLSRQALRKGLLSPECIKLMNKIQLRPCRPREGPSVPCSAFRLARGRGVDDEHGDGGAADQALGDAPGGEVARQALRRHHDEIGIDALDHLQNLCDGLTKLDVDLP